MYSGHNYFLFIFRHLVLVLYRGHVSTAGRVARAIYNDVYQSLLSAQRLQKPPVQKQYTEPFKGPIIILHPYCGSMCYWDYIGYMYQSNGWSLSATLSNMTWNMSWFWTVLTENTHGHWAESPASHQWEGKFPKLYIASSLYNSIRKPFD